MNKCSVCGSIESIVHSGTDALMLGCLDSIGKICYPCANKPLVANEVKRIYSAYHARSMSAEQALDELEQLLNNSEVLA